MSRFSTAVVTPAAASGAPYLTIHTGATYRAIIYEMGILTQATTASFIGLIRPSNTPVATTSQLGQNEDGSSTITSTVNVDTAWSTAPTIGTNFLREAIMPANADAYTIWTWPFGLIIPTSSWLVLWNNGASAASALDVHVVWDE